MTVSKTNKSSKCSILSRWKSQDDFVTVRPSKKKKNVKKNERGK